MTKDNKDKLKRIIRRIDSQIDQLFGNMPHDEDDTGVEDEIILDIATLISRDTSLALQLCNVEVDITFTGIMSEDEKIDKTRLAVERIWENTNTVSRELEDDVDEIDLDAIVHLLKSMARDTNILIHYSK